MKFLIETGIFEDRELAFGKAAASKGHDVEYITSRPFGEDVGPQPTEGPMFFYGSLNLASRLLHREDVRRAVFYEKSEFECHRYYGTRWDQHLLNTPCIMVPYPQLMDMKDSLYRMFGEDGCIFIRPSSGDKVFTGQVVEYERFERDIEYMSFYMDDIHKPLCVIARPQKIEAEARMWVVNGIVVTGSIYKGGEYSEVVRESPGWAYAQTIAAEAYVAGTQPSTIYTLDIAILSDGYKVLELGCGSCSALYAANPDLLADAISEHIIEVTP